MTDKQRENHILVIGGGLAGLSASVEALRNGAKVTLIEKQKQLTGNSAKASSGINAAGTVEQAAKLIDDTADIFYRDTFKSSNEEADAEKVKILASKSAEAISFLTDLGVNLDSLSQGGGHSMCRTHRNSNAPDARPLNVGWHIVSTLAKHIQDTFPADKLKIMTNYKVIELLKEKETNKVFGVKVVSTADDSDGGVETVVGDAVILSTGGFSADRSELLREFKPDYIKFPTTNGDFALGEGVKLARSIGAELRQMDYIQLHPTGIVDPKDPEKLTKILAPEALRGLGGILINRKGKRFANELGYRDYVTEQVFKQKDTFSSFHQLKKQEEEEQVASIQGDLSVAYLVLNDDIIKEFGEAVMSFYKNRMEIVTSVANGDDLAALLGCDVNTLRQTIETYNTHKESNTKDEYGKTRFPVSFNLNEELSVIVVTPSIHYCMGGLDTTAEGRVKDTHGHVIEGLFAAGEVASGVHGRNRLVGNSLAECVVFGRIAGKLAAASQH